MKKMIVVCILLVLFVSLVGCTTRSDSLPYLENAPWREFTIVLKSGESLTFCAVYGKVDINILNEIVGIEFYNDEGNLSGPIYNDISSIEANQDEECK